ncbi:GDSL-type esterase/lipase family protein [Parabacteroides sp. OttesenSCG-928-G21]|nr:GDSL-type esterase/lipase family protein [Parabacteroides sp. OttesenSCG-928-G21]
MQRAVLKPLLLFCISFFFLACEAKEGTVITPDNPHIAYIGRVSFANPESPCFTYPGVQIQAIFEGTSIALQMKPNSGYFMIELDDREPFKVNFTETDSILTLAEGLPDERHKVTVTLAYEGYQRRPEFRGFILDPGKKLPIAPELPQRKIEFIGNSITCGYGNEAPDANAPFRDETSNHYYTYAAITARAFHAQSLVVAKSGIGIYRNYGGPKTGSQDCMPAMYHQTLFTDNRESWDFNRYTPDVVCINLGTNDVSTQPYDVKLLEEGYRNFLQTVRKNYPQAKIVLLTGCMLSGKALQDVQRVMNRVVKEANDSGDKAVYRFDFPPQDGNLGYGAHYHPSLAQHRKMAEELIPFISGIMGWDNVKIRD